MHIQLDGSRNVPESFQQVGMGIVHFTALTAWQASFYPVHITILLPFSTVSPSSSVSSSAVLRQDLAEGGRDTYSPGLRGHHHASHTETTIDTQLSLAA